VLAVPADVLAQHGAVSPETRRRHGALPQWQQALTLSLLDTVPASRPVRPGISLLRMRKLLICALA